MAGERHGTASWPGALAVDSCIYSMGHGISPGTAVLKILPQADPPAMSGTLVIGDGAASVSFPDCRLDDIKVEQTESGFLWSLQISDRRWKWRDFGAISGAYNQLDEAHKKLIPWTIQSPTELAKLCLDLMGEKGYEIDLPPGFDAATGKRFATLNPPWIGVNPGNANPPVNWEAQTPAVALQNLCEQFGRRVILRADTNTVLIAIPGIGADLPDGSVARESPGLKNPATPSRVAVYGGPTRYQCRLALEAVGEEWDGSFRAIDQLSYIPQSQGRPQIAKATPISSGASNSYQIFIGAAPDQPPTTGALIEITSSGDAAAVSAALAAAINASDDPLIRGKVTATSDATSVTVTGVAQGVSITVWAKMSGTVTGSASIVATVTQSAIRPGGSWRFSDPPVFGDVIRGPGSSTDRLRYQDALRLAQKTVYKYYRLTGVDASPQRGAARIPNYGRITRRQQILLTPFQVEQVIPTALDARLQGADGRPFLENFYNGYSRDKPAICYGSMVTIKASGAANAWWVPTLGLTNTPASQQIYIDFTVDPENQLVIFSNHVFRKEGAEYMPSAPVLQTGVMIRNAQSNALEVYISGKTLPGVVDNNNVAARKYPDVQLNIIGTYDEMHRLLGATILEPDAQKRASFYVDGLAAQYITSAALTREYNGIVLGSLDGAISQITWQVGPNGASTVMSRNTEHSLYVPPYPARRRAEFLRPAEQAAIQQAVNPGNLGGSLHTPARPIVYGTGVT